MGYLPIEDYGVIGNMRSVALVGMNGSIDWLCYPHFDSPSVFAALLDEHKGGSFRIAPLDEETRTKQFYWPETNVLVTRFLGVSGVAEIEDFMPVSNGDKPGQKNQIIRRIKVTRGTIRFRMHCQPAFNYARTPHSVHNHGQGVIFETPDLSLFLASETAIRHDGTAATAEFELQQGESAVFMLQMLEDVECEHCPSKDQAQEYFEATVDYWHHWISQCTYAGRWREMVHRSALMLKLLTFEPTGAMVASPTCSLPEDLGGVRNWDYRYTWIRDAAFTLYGLMRIGFTQEAEGFMRWLEARLHEAGRGQPLQIMYGLDGRTELTEHTLDHLEGYRQSKPVRIGNGAQNQLQLDIYGELLDSIYLYNKYGAPISYDIWLYVRDLLNWVCENWQRKDEGIWEVRHGQQHFVYSKLMCWVALDRGLRLADKRSFPADRDRWLVMRDRIYEEILQYGWNSDRQAFTQFYGSSALDASTLIMPLVFFMAPNDPRMLKTIDAIMKPPEQHGLVTDSLVYRYDTQRSEDGVEGQEGTFNMCTFWLVEALTRAGRVDRSRLAQARLLFERMLGYANHLGLYAEETGSHGEALGNFPQAFTHLALISAAFNLDRQLGSGG